MASRWSNVCPDCGRYRHYCKCKPEDLIRLGGMLPYPGASDDQRVPIKMPPPRRGKHGR